MLGPSQTGLPKVGRWHLNKVALVSSEGDMSLDWSLTGCYSQDDLPNPRALSTWCLSLPTCFPLPEASRPLAWSISRADHPDLPVSLGAQWVLGARTRPGGADWVVMADSVSLG